MKNFIYLFFFLIISNCSINNENVYWCGDHACINKKEKEAYFKKTMIVEVKKIKKYTESEKTEIEKITEQARKNERKRIKNGREKN